MTLLNHGPSLALQLGDYLSGVLTSAALSRGRRIIDTVAARVERNGRVVLAEGRVRRPGLVTSAADDIPNVAWFAVPGCSLRVRWSPMRQGGYPPTFWRPGR